MAIKNNNNERTDLGYLGEEFQYRLLKAFIEDHGYFKDLLPIINQNCFTARNLRVIVGFLKEFVEKENYVPSYELLSSLLGTILGNIELEEVREQLKLVQKTSSEGSDIIKSNGIKFFKQQEFIKTFQQGLSYVARGVDISDTDVEERIRDIMSIGKTEKIWTTVYEDLENTLAEEREVRIPLGVPEIDSYLEGGFIKGNLALVAAGSGIGKTTISSALASNAATHRCEQNNYEGFKVLQIYFEDKHRAIKKKHIGKITGIEARNLTKREYIDVVKENVQKYDDRTLIEKNLKLGKFRTGELTATQLKNHIKMLVQQGFQPDVILIDYFECLVNPKVSTTGSEWTGETAKMRELENFTEDFGCLVVVTTQGTKESAQGMLLTLDKISGSAGKGQVAHMIMTINKSEADKENDRATIYIPKFREGKSGRSFNVNFNNGTCQINVDKMFDSLDELNESKAKDTNKLMEEARKQVLKSAIKNDEYPF